jgi:hypothetical protein
MNSVKICTVEICIDVTVAFALSTLLKVANASLRGILTI